MQEMPGTLAQSLGWEDPLEEEMATPVFLPGKSHGQRSLMDYLVHRVTKELDRTQQINSKVANIHYNA